MANKPLSTVELVSSLVSLIKGLSIALVAITIEWGERRRRFAEAELARVETELRIERARDDVEKSFSSDPRAVIKHFLDR